MRDVLVIKDLETLKVLSDPTRVAILEQLTEPRSVKDLAAALHVPRTRLYHHIDLLRSKGLLEVASSRRARGLEEQLYTPAAKLFRVDPRLMQEGELAERVAAITTLVFDATKADLQRSVLSGAASFDGEGERGRVGLGRSVAVLSAGRAAEFLAELEALVARFDEAHDAGGDGRAFALTWALYPSTGSIR